MRKYKLPIYQLNLICTAWYLIKHSPTRSHPPTPVHISLFPVEHCKSSMCSIYSSGTTAIRAMHPPGPRSLNTRPPHETATELHHGARELVTDAGPPPRCCCSDWGATSTTAEARSLDWSCSGSGMVCMSMRSGVMVWAGMARSMSRGSTSTPMGESVHEAGFDSGLSCCRAGRDVSSSSESHVRWWLWIFVREPSCDGVWKVRKVFEELVRSWRNSPFISTSPSNHPP